MTIRSEVNVAWGDVLEVFTPEERKMLINEAEHLANGLKWLCPTVRISTNGALEVLFKMALLMEEMEKVTKVRSAKWEVRSGK